MLGSPEQSIANANVDKPNNENIRCPSSRQTGPKGSVGVPRTKRAAVRPRRKAQNYANKLSGSWKK